MVLVSFQAAGIGLIAGCVAFLLYKLIGLFTNIVFYHRFVADFTSARHHQLGAWVILMPVIGGILVGFMAKYGTPKIKGHGIPEAMEAVLSNRSRIQPRVAILKPISAAIAAAEALRRLGSADCCIGLKINSRSRPLKNSGGRRSARLGSESLVTLCRGFSAWDMTRSATS
jgi:hypothetical protein